MSENPENTPINDDAEMAASTSYRYNFDSLDDYIVTTEKAAGDGRLDEAVEVMREGVRRYPESPTGRYNLGVALFLLLKKDREHQELWENLADDEQLAEEAIMALEGAVTSDPSFVQAYNNLGTLYALRGRKEHALASWKKSLELNPDQPDVRADMDMYTSTISPTDEDLETRRLAKESVQPDRES